MQKTLENVPNLSQEAHAMLEEFAAAVRERLGDRVKMVELFGSRARGDAHEDSDFDVLVVVDHRDYDIFSAVCDEAFDAAFQRDELLVPLVMSEETWRRHLELDTLLSREILTDGLLL